MKYIPNFKAPPVADMKVNTFIQSCREQFKKIGLAINRGHDVRALAYKAANQENISNTVLTLIELDTVLYDPNGDFDTSNHYFVVPVNGFYQVIGQVAWVNGTVVADKRWRTYLYKNDDIISMTSLHSSHTGAMRVLSSSAIECSKDDTISLKAWHDAGVNTPDVHAGFENQTFLVVYFVR